MSKKRLPSRENNEMNPCTRPMRKPGGLWMFGTICAALYDDATNKPNAKRKNHFIWRLPSFESRVLAGCLPRNNLRSAYASAMREAREQGKSDQLPLRFERKQSPAVRVRS